MKTWSSIPSCFGKWDAASDERSCSGRRASQADIRESSTCHTRLLRSVEGCFEVPPRSQPAFILLPRARSFYSPLTSCQAQPPPPPSPPVIHPSHCSFLLSSSPPTFSLSLYFFLTRTRSDFALNQGNKHICGSSQMERYEAPGKKKKKWTVAANRFVIHLTLNDCSPGSAARLVVA